MPEYTLPHGIYKPQANDRVKDSYFASKLASDIGAVAETANVAISAESGRIKQAASQDAADKSAAAEQAAVQQAKKYTDQVVNTSNLSLDTDGTPYFSPGSMTLRVFSDTDGVPFFTET